MKSKLINILHDDGSVTAYRPVSQRLPAFLRQYSPEQGYAVVIEVQDTLSLRPGLRQLTAVQAESIGAEAAGSQDDDTADFIVVPLAPNSNRTESVPTTPASQKPTDSSGPPPAALARQITHLATMKQRNVPAYTTAAEAKAVLKQLMQF